MSFQVEPPPQAVSPLFRAFHNVWEEGLPYFEATEADRMSSSLPNIVAGHERLHSYLDMWLNCVVPKATALIDAQDPLGNRAFREASAVGELLVHFRVVLSGQQPTGRPTWLPTFTGMRTASQDILDLISGISESHTPVAVHAMEDSAEILVTRGHAITPLPGLEIAPSARRGGRYGLLIIGGAVLVLGIVAAMIVRSYLSEKNQAPHR